jgi:HlyD family secretion protein
MKSVSSSSKEGALMKKLMKKGKLPKVMLIAVITAGLAAPLSGCASSSDVASAADNQVATVERGDITIDITAAGNLSYSQQEDLAFEMAGTVEEVLVAVGDSVEEGQVLATLDASAWEDNLSALEDQVTAKERSLLQAQISLKNAEVALDNAENPYSEDDIKEAKQNLSAAEQQLRYDLQHGPESSIAQDQQKVYQYQQTLDDMLAGGDENDIAVKQMQLDLAQGQLEDAEKALTKAQEALDDAQSESPEITAPFGGFITQVSVSGGDEVLKGTVGVQIADPTRFEVELLVSEMDIYKVKLGGDAQVTVDALEGMSLPAEVTYISPTATIQSGVVNYEVTVEVASLETIRQQQEEAMQARQEEMQALSPGELPERLQAAVEQGQITQEQAEEMVQRMQQMGGVASEQMPTLIPEDFELREGLSVTVSIVIEQASDVLLVPNQAITYRGGEAYVQVVSADGTTEERSIQTGISDWQYTEVTEGLTEGEQVVLPQTTSTGTSTTSEQGFRGPGGNGFFIGGGGPP